MKVEAFVGVVPSAGASRRMGRSKALLPLEGTPFVRHAVTALRDGGCAKVLVVVADGDARVAEESAAAGAHVIVNPDPGEGPITSLRLALEQLDPGVAGIVWLPVDHPLVLPETVRALLAEARASGAAVTLPVRGTKRGHPAVFRRALFGELLDPSLEGGARTVVHRHLHHARLLPVDDRGVTADIDTPEAYERIVPSGLGREAGVDG